MTRLPWALIATRAALAPVVILLALNGQGPWIAVAIVAATLTDIFDGVVARRLGVATEALRRADSLIDTVFYLGVLAAVLLLFSEVVRIHAVGLAALIGLEVARAGYDLWRYRRLAAYHMWSAKAWGVALALGLVALFGWGQTGWPVAVAVWLGVATNAEGLAASVVLDRWHHDVPSLAHALRIARRTPEQPAP